MSDWLKIVDTTFEIKDVGPQPDIVICSCSWRGPISDCGCETDQDGWEMPEYLVDICPKCGEQIEHYNISDEQLKLWSEWDARQSQKSRSDLTK